MGLSFFYPTTLYALLLLPALLALPFIGRRALPRAFNFWAGLILRALVLLGLILGLAGTQLVLAVHDMTVVFVVDRSDSIPPAEQERAVEFIRAALGAMRPGHRAAIVVFGENALVDRLASEDALLAPIVSVPRTTRTNLAAALRLALALFPEETHKRIVLLSDGLENVGRAAEVVELARARGISIDVVPLKPPTGQAEAYLDALQSPTSVRQGQAFELTAIIQSNVAGAATLRLFGDGKLIETRALTLQAGSNRVNFSLTAEQTGFRRYTAELQAASDTLLQNNAAAAFTVVYGPPRVLVVGNTPGDADDLIAALASSSIKADLVAPSALPADLAALAGYEAVFLVNVPKEALPDSAMETLPAYVRDLGRGLVMLGGADSFGAGGYLRTELEQALPVDMDVRSRAQEPNLALVFVIDKSGSMGKCHCDNPNLLPGQYVRAESGLSKIDIAKDAVMQSASLLGRTDYIGVVAFDSNALWALRVQALTDPKTIDQYIGGLRAEGQTNIYAGLSEAEQALAQNPARLKHVILLTDGWSRSGDFDALARKMQDEGITLSVVAAGGGSATYLDALARAGGGRYYAAPTMSEVPQLFFKETIQAVGSYIIEEPFYPVPAGVTPILRGLDVTRLPALRGYNGTTPKSTAHVALVSGRGDPLLATWQYGLGRAAAWTSDVKGQWAAEWVTWDGFNTFVAQLANWVMPQPADEGLQTTLSADGAQTVIEVAGRPDELLDTQAIIVDPNFVSHTVALAQVAPGLYRGEMPAAASQPGVYLVNILQRDASGHAVASATVGWAATFSPEYKLLSNQEGLSNLQALSAASGGQVIDDPALAFAPIARPATRAQPVWPALLLMTALLFPLDAAARRLRLTGEDWLKLLAWLRLPFDRRGIAAPRQRVLDNLFAARERAFKRSNAPTLQRSDTPKIETETSAAETPPPPATPEEMAQRLKQARDRARGRR